MEPRKLNAPFDISYQVGIGYSGPEWLNLHGFSRPLNGPFFDKKLQPAKAVNEGFKDRSLGTKA